MDVGTGGLRDCFMVLFEGESNAPSLLWNDGCDFLLAYESCLDRVCGSCTYQMGVCDVLERVALNGFFASWGFEWFRYSSFLDGFFTNRTCRTTALTPLWLRINNNYARNCAKVYTLRG
jgi:hypothetical protein